MATHTAVERTPRGQGEQLRERLVEAGVGLVDDGTDPAQLSIRAVTRRAGVSPTAFYLHFENLDELLRAMVSRCFTQFRDAVREGTAQGSDPADRLTRAGRAYTQFARRWPARYALNFVHAKPAGDESPEKPDAADDSFNDLVALVLDYLGEDHPLRDEAGFLARGIWSGLHGFVTLCAARSGMGWPSEEQFVARLARAWLGEPHAEAAQ